MNGNWQESVGETKRDAANVIVLPPLWYLGMLLTGLAIHWFRPIRLLEPGPAHVTGGVLVAAGLGLGLWGRRTMLATGTNINPRKPSLAVVDGGPFRFTRNPLYVGLTVVYAGLSSLVDSAWPLLLLPLVLAVMHWGVILREEQYLESKFGEAYLAYKVRVRRWL